MTTSAAGTGDLGAAAPGGLGSGGVTCSLVADAAEVAEHHRIRRAVFVTEQEVFADSDLDAHDARADVVHVVARIGRTTVGTVRLFPLDGVGLWQGDRLAVLPDFRSAGVGGPLVRFAVAAATARGGRRMVAHVQPANRRFFEYLGWVAEGTEVYAGRPHVAMTIALRSGSSDVRRPDAGAVGPAARS